MLKVGAHTLQGAAYEAIHTSWRMTRRNTLAKCRSLLLLSTHILMCLSSATMINAPYNDERGTCGTPGQ